MLSNPAKVGLHPRSHPYLRMGQRLLSHARQATCACHALLGDRQTPTVSEYGAHLVDSSLPRTFRCSKTKGEASTHSLSFTRHTRFNAPCLLAASRSLFVGSAFLKFPAW